MEFEVGVVSDRNGQACAIPNFNLPMRQVGALGKEDGRSLAFVVGDGHLLVRQGSVVKKLAQDLSTELWRANVGPGFGVGSSDREAIVVVAEGARPILRVIDTTTGNLTRDLPMPNDASLVALVGPQGA